MARLPIPGGDENSWGNVLNDFLATSLNGDGTLKTSAISDAIGASDVSFASGGTIAATDVQAAVSEVATDAASALSTHAADATIHSSGREIAYATTTSAQGSIGSFTQLTGLSVTVPAGGARPVYLTGIVHLSNNTADASMTLAILPDGLSNPLNAVNLAVVTIRVANRQAEAYIEYRLPAGTGGTYHIWVQPGSGTGTTVATSIAPCIFKAVEA